MEQNNNNAYAPPTARVADPAPELDSLTRPRQVELAVWFLCGSFVVGYINQYIVVRLTTSLPVRGLIPTIFGVALGGALTYWICTKILLGRNWMRITFLVLYILGLLVTPLNYKILFRQSLAVTIVFGVQSILQLIFLWLVFTKPGSDWFRKRTN